MVVITTVNSFQTYKQYDLCPLEGNIAQLHVILGGSTRKYLFSQEIEYKVILCSYFREPLKTSGVA